MNTKFLWIKLQVEVSPAQEGPKTSSISSYCSFVVESSRYMLQIRINQVLLLKTNQSLLMKRRETKVNKYSTWKKSTSKGSKNLITFEGNNTSSKTKDHMDGNNQTVQYASHHIIEAAQRVAKKNICYNKENYLLSDEYKRGEKKTIEVRKKKPNKRAFNEYVQNHDSEEGRKTLDSGHLKMRTKQEVPEYVHIMNTQHTQSIIQYEQYWREENFQCVEQLLWQQKQTISMYKKNTPQSYLLEEKRNPQEEILKFQQQIEHIQMQFESASMCQIVMREHKYKAIKHFPNYLTKAQPHLTWDKRAILVNWMMEVMAGLGSKRQTCAIAIDFLDRYLALSDHIPLQKVQLVGGVAMLLADKVEDRIFSVGDLLQAMGQKYSLSEMLSCEVEMSCKLGWKLHPPTCVMWGNRLCAQWDQYSRQQPSEPISEVRFRAETMQAYTNYRELMQYIDLAMLQVHTLQYNCRQLAASFMYIIVCMRLQLHSREQINKYYPHRSAYLLSPHPINHFFNRFLMESFGVGLNDLLPTIQYCSTFLTGAVCLGDAPSVEKCTFSEYCSYQTYNEYGLFFLHKRDRALF